MDEDRRKILAAIIIIATFSFGIFLVFNQAIFNGSNSCDPSVYSCSADLMGFYPDNSNQSFCLVCTYNNGLVTAPQSFIQANIGYITNLYNPTVGLVAVGTSTTCNPNGCGVPFNYRDGSGACPEVPNSQRFIPFESWKDAAALAGLGSNPQISSKIFSTIQGLETSLDWRPPQNLESVLGYLTGFTIQNTNVCFTPNYGPPTYVNINGQQAQLDQAIPWNYATQSFKAPDMNVAKGVGLHDPENTLAQAINLDIRGDKGDAKGNLQAVADLCRVNPDGSVGFGSPPYRGILLGTFLEAEQIIGTPKLKIGCTIQAIIKTMVAIQQPDGGVANGYNCGFAPNCVISNSIDEASNASLLGLSPGVITHIRNLAASGKYNLNTIPNTSPAIGI